MSDVTVEVTGQPSVDVDVSPTGATGPSAYEVAVAQGFVGDETAWLASLKGADGADGADGSDGAPGADGNDGADGKSAYQVAVDEGFVGDETAWLASLKGADGSDGAAGADGSDGADGDSAYDVAVANGFVGDETAWLASLVGEAGADGSDGSPGAAGADGKTILNGTGAPSSGLGVDGDFYIDTTADAIYGPKSSGEWGSSTSLVGPQGAAGNDGSPGADGADGADGAGVAAGGSTGQVLAKASATDYDTEWADDLAVAEGSANNPHTSAAATRNSDLPKNFWQTSTEPDNWLDGDEWIVTT